MRSVPVDAIAGEATPAMLRAVDDQRLGTVIRQVRIRRGLRQSDLARLANTSRATVSRIERGHVGSLSVDVLRRAAAAVDVRIDLVPRWRAGDLDRLLNSKHSRFHEEVATRFRAFPGWMLRPEVSFAIRGERGVVDILAFHRDRQLLLVIELKTDIADVNELLGTLDRKRRLALPIAREQGIPVGAATGVAVWLIVADGATNRRRIAAHRTMLRAALPTNGRSIQSWLRRPDEPIRALSIWSYDHGRNVRSDLAAIRRVSRRGSPRAERGSGARPGQSLRLNAGSRANVPGMSG